VRFIYIFFLFEILFAERLAGQTFIDLSEMDSIKVVVNQNAEPVYRHTVKKGETVFSIARFFKVNHKDLLIRNGFQPGDIIPLEALLEIPLNTEYLVKQARRPSIDCIPVYYAVKKRETLFKISQVFFDQRIEDLVVRNSIDKLSLGIGQELLVGWWPVTRKSQPDPMPHPHQLTKVEPVQPLRQHIVEGTLDHDDYYPPASMSIDSTHTTLDTDSLILASKHNIVSDKGIAVWEREDANDASLLVLHRSASIGSTIKLQNPVTDLIVVAQVVGHIPANVYTPDVDLVISRAVAQKLGALDTRFQVLMTFYE